MRCRVFFFFFENQYHMRLRPFHGSFQKTLKTVMKSLFFTIVFKIIRDNGFWCLKLFTKIPVFFSPSACTSSLLLTHSTPATISPSCPAAVSCWHYICDHWNTSTFTILNIALVVVNLVGFLFEVIVRFIFSYMLKLFFF